MYRNVFYNNRSRDITLWTWDDDGNRIEKRIPFKPYIYFEQKDGKDGMSIFKTPLKKREFETAFDRNKFVQNSGIKRIFYNLPAEQQFLIDQYGDIPNQTNFTENPLRIFYLDIEVFSPDEFPVASDAKHPVNLITIYDSLIDKYHTWGMHPYATQEDNIIYHKCNTETDLFKSFMKYWTNNYPDIITGWNCLNLNEHIWLPNKIVKMSNLSKNTQLYMSDNVNIYKETGMKDEFCLETALGNMIYSSKDHKFPIYFKGKNQYKNFNTLSKNVKDITVSEIINQYKDIDLFVRIEKRINDNEPLTFRKLIANNINKIIKNNIEILLDDINFKNKIKSLGLCDELRPEYHQGTTFWKRCPSFWNSNNIVEIFDEFDIEKYIKSVDHIYVKRNGGNPFKIVLDDIIPNDVLKLLGFIFTDGSLDKNMYTFSSKYEYLSQYYTDIYSNLTGKLYTPPNKCNDGNYYKKININNSLGLLHCFIYDENGNKKLDVELISLLSYNQFSSLFSGFIDGDGFIDKNGINLCNFDKGYQDNLHRLQELLLWNNIQSSVHRNVLRISASQYNKDFIVNLPIENKFRLDKINNLIFKEKLNSSSKSIKFFEDYDHMIVKIDKVNKTGRSVPMADIETTSHYFTCNGIKTHNCDGFDIPYIVNRMNYLFEESYSNRLSPVGRIRSNETLDRFKNPITEWSIEGISCIDYLKAYKKFSRNERESYTLHYIGEHEEIGGKIDYDGTLAQLSIQNWSKFVDYNIRDVEIVKKLEEKLKFMGLCRMIAYKGLTKFEKSLATTNVVGGAFALEARRKGMIIPTFEYDRGAKPSGGLVREPNNGYKENVVSFDAASLYPNTMISLNLSPETKLGKSRNDGNFTYIRTVRGKEFKLKNNEFEKWMRENKVCKSMNGTLFSQQEKGIIPTIIEGIYSDRKSTKDRGKKLERKIKRIKKDDPDRNKLQREIDDCGIYEYTLKILMNSIYGTFGNNYSILYDLDLSDSITLTGQEVNHQSVIAVQSYAKNKYNFDGDLLIYGDTDSIYLTLTPLFKQLGIKLLEDDTRIEGKPFKITEEAMNIIREIGGEENPHNGAITSHLSKWALKELNSLDPRFEFKREKISKCGIFLERKKRYALQVVDNEGVPVSVGDKKEFSFTGIEGIVTSTHAKEVQDINKEVVKTMLMTNDDILSNESIKKSYSDFCKLSPEILSTRKSVKDLKKYQGNASGFDVFKGTPQNSKAAILYNNLVDHLNLENKYAKIESGDKIKIIYLAKNRFGIDYIGFKSEFPKEFELVPNYKLLYMKLVYPVIERVYNSVGWIMFDPTKDYACDLLAEFS